MAFLASDAAGLHHRRGAPGRRRPRHGPLTRPATDSFVRTGLERDDTMTATRLGLLAGKNLLITGVITEASMAFHTARLAQEQGATGGAHRVRSAVAWWSGSPSGCRSPRRSSNSTSPTRRSSTRWPTGSASTVTDPGLDGVLHSIGFAPATALGGALPGRPVGGRRHHRARLGLLAEVAGRGGLPLLSAGRVDRRPGLRRPAGLAGLRLDGRGQGRARVGDPLPGPRSRAEGDPGQPGRGGPDQDDGGQVHPRASPTWRTAGTTGRRWAGTPPTRRRSRRRVCALLSDWFPATSGSMVWADGGFHAVGV